MACQRFAVYNGAMQLLTTTHMVTGTEAHIAAQVEEVAAEVARRAEFERRLAHRMTAAYRMLEDAGLLE